MKITIRLGKIWRGHTDANVNSFQERKAEVKPIAVTHLGVVTLVPWSKPEAWLTSREQPYCCQPSLNITCSSHPQMCFWKENCLCSRKNFSLHTSHCHSSLREGLLLSLPGISTNASKQDWAQQGPATFQRNCLTQVEYSSLEQDTLNPCWCSFQPPGRGTGRCGLQHETRRHEDMVQMPFCPRSRNNSVQLCI